MHQQVTSSITSSVVRMIWVEEVSATSAVGGGPKASADGGGPDTSTAGSELVATMPALPQVPKGSRRHDSPTKRELPSPHPSPPLRPRHWGRPCPTFT
jgi:hypothetical protein